MRRRASSVGLAAAVFLGLVLTGTPAHAHANLVSTSPASGSQLDEPPAEVRLRFTERVTVAPDGVQLHGAGGGEIATEPAAPDPADPTVVVLPMPADLPDGGYVVSFRAVSADSHPVAGALVFGVGVPVGSLSDVDISAQDPVVAPVFAAARWTSYAGLAMLAGALVVFGWCWPAGWSNRRARRVVLTGWVASLAGAVAVLVLQGPYSAGRSLSHVTDPALLAATMDTDFGRYVLARLGLVLAAGGLLLVSPRPPWRTAGAVALGIALPATWLGTGHANTAGNPVDAVADLAHLVAMSSWFGGLALLAICVLPRSAAVPAEEVGGVLRRFSLLATGAVATLVVTGTYVAWRRVGSLDALVGTPYGRLLAFKLATMGVLLWLGALSRSAVQRRYARPAEPAADAAASRSKRRAARAGVDQERAARSQLHASVRLEAGAAVAVLAIASVLVATPPGVVVSGRAGPPGGVAAGEAIAEAPAGPLVDDVVLEEDNLIVQVLVDPAWVGENRVSVAVTDLAFGPLDVPEVRASFVLPDDDLGPLPVELTRTGPGEYEAVDAQLPSTGDWRLDVAVRTTEIDSRTVQVDVPVG
jgi:copper transport protein